MDSEKEQETTDCEEKPEGTLRGLRDTGPVPTLLPPPYGQPGVKFLAFYYPGALGNLLSRRGSLLDQLPADISEFCE